MYTYDDEEDEDQQYKHSIRFCKEHYDGFGSYYLGRHQDSSARLFCLLFIEDGSKTTVNSDSVMNAYSNNQSKFDHFHATLPALFKVRSLMIESIIDYLSRIDPSPISFGYNEELPQLKYYLVPKYIFQCIFPVDEEGHSHSQESAPVLVYAIVKGGQIVKFMKKTKPYQILMSFAIKIYGTESTGDTVVSSSFFQSLFRKKKKDDLFPCEKLFSPLMTQVMEHRINNSQSNKEKTPEGLVRERTANNVNSITDS